MDDMWPTIEFVDGYPVDEDFSEFADLPIDFSQAAFWLLNELPRAAENMPCFCDVERPATDDFGRDCVRIKFSTGGWSGAESIMALIERRFDLSHFIEGWKRGGHYVFELPVKKDTPNG